MLRITFERVRDDKIARLRAWMHELSQRRDEVLETFANEGIRHEQVYLMEGKDGPVLVYAMEGDDFDRAREAFQTSTLSIDLEHKQVMSEVSGGRIDAELLWQCEV